MADDTIKNRIQQNNVKLENITDIVENLPAALSLNIFTQLTEPTTKKGIWLKKDAKYEHIYGDDNVVESESWYPDGIYRNIPYQFNFGSTAAVGTDIYLLGGSNSKANNYKYDTLTNTYTKMANIPSNNFMSGSAASVDTNIYLFGGATYDNDGSIKNAYKYDTLTDTYTQLTNIPSKFWYGAAVAVGTDIYLLGGRNTISISQNNYKYDTLTDTYTKMTNIPYSFDQGSAVAIGTNIYIFGGSDSYAQYAYKYDTLTDTYTQLTNIPSKFCGGGISTVGTNIYLFGSNYTSYAQYAYKYDTLTDTYTQLTNIPYKFGVGSASISGINIYLFGGYDYKTKVQCMQVVSKTFENNSVVISQGRLYNVGYAVEIFSNSIMSEPLLYAFADAWYYTTQGGLETDIPTYYGDGTQWINIKNPPQ